MVPFFYFNRQSVAWPKITSFLQALRDNEAANLPIGISSQCWGGPATFRLASDEADTRTRDGKKPLADAFFAAHPSNVSIPDAPSKVRTNISVANGDKDMALSIEKVEQVKAILEKLEGVDSEVVVYPGAGHGFSVRADTENNKEQAKQAEDAEKQAIGM